MFATFVIEHSKESGSESNFEKSFQAKKWLRWCWWRILETKYVGDNFKILVTVLAIWSPTFTIYMIL